MNSKNEKPNHGNNPSIQLEIIRNSDGSSSNPPKDRWGSTLFEPQRQQSYQTPSSSNERSQSSSKNANIPAPEKKLTLFALHLAILEKSASGLGTLGFIWATVVLLGGYASTLESKDFWIVTVILLIEATRIFSRSHEIEWQHQSTSWSLASAGRYSFRAFISSSQFFAHAIKAFFQSCSVFQSDNHRSREVTHDLWMETPESQNRNLQNKNERTWNYSDVPFLPYVGWVFLSRNVSNIFYWLQLISAAASAALSLMRLSQQDYIKDSGYTDTKNLKPALNIFYGMALAEALMFLVEKAYWNWEISYKMLLDKVCQECALGPSGMTSITRFFYDSYSRCIEGSIFDGLRMDLVSFAEELLDSEYRDEQLIGARILHKFVTNDQFSSYTLRKIGTSTEVIERLIEILNWKNPLEEEIRRSATEIVSKLAGRKQNAIRVAEIPGAIESISSLLYTGLHYDSRPHEIGHRFVVADQTDYEFSVFNLLGLMILKKLARDHDNCWKIGNARGLMPKIIDFTSTTENLLRNDLAPESQIKIVKRSLKLIKILASTTGQTGKMLRKEISDIVFTVSNIREILQYGESHMVLQMLGIEILSNLAMDEDARESIGSTGGVIRLLLSIFFMPRLTEKQNSVCTEAGEALTMLAFESRRNCNQIVMGPQVMERLVDSLNDPVLQVNSARILRNLCAYSGPECVSHFTGVAAAVPTVLQGIMNGKDKLLEVSLGLATQMFIVTTRTEYAEQLERAGITDEDIANRLVQILRIYIYPEIKVPRIRRFLIELVIWMLKLQSKYIQIFKNLQADEAFKSIAETTSELESFNFFSGSVGMGKDNITLSSLIDTAVNLME
ncbi:uncharacterized protein LOC109848388 isoform X1 [Asparagus officinalis]|uniref:uncharacterized protein LOC109848388 isoform X1 n=1 Tax=Asparagus officinalis TaxID=4686 RepID=UPI00098E1B79|nr:uncharacterized protein LOC109848388 isoform X1 [Asparagus officinalis]